MSVLFQNLDEYTVRTYQEGDEIQLTNLFNEVYQSYAGFVPKTLEYWRWSCRDRPDVEKEGIIIAVYRRKIVAYAVVGKSGNIWELCVDSAHNTQVAVSLILERAIDYLTRVGAESIDLNLPSDDFAARRSCEELGFAEVPSEKMFLSIIDFKAFLSLLSDNKSEKLMGFNESILISFKDAPFWISPHVWVKMENGQIVIEEGNKPYDVLIETDTATFTSIVLGTTNPLWALMRLKLKIHPLRKLGEMLRWFSLVRLSDPWFFPSSDYG